MGRMTLGGHLGDSRHLSKASLKQAQTSWSGDVKMNVPEINPGRKRYFTVEEANQTLPLVKAVVGDIVRQYQEIQQRKERLSRIRPPQKKPRATGGTLYDEEVRQIEEELEKEVARLQEYVLELHALGVELKDFNKGLVDFPAKQDGREIYLCWFLGEHEVSHWHELDAGFAGRQSLLATSATTPGKGNPAAGGDSDLDDGSGEQAAHDAGA